MTRSPGPACRPLRPVGTRGLRDDERAVSDVLGSILLVGITVASAVGFGLLLLSFDGPPDVQHTRLSVILVPGAGGWNSGDEALRVTHLGGEPLRRSVTTIQYTPPSGVPVQVTGTGLGGGFGDGELRIGETWTQTVTAAANDAFAVQVVVRDATSQLLADFVAVAGAAGGVLCVGDVSAPTASFVQAPANLNSLYLGAVTVTVTLADNCSGVDESVAPHLLWCVAVVCSVPASYTDAGAMTDTGLRTWSASVPAQIWLTQGLAGASLRYYVTSMTDFNGNVAQSPVQVDLVDLVYTYTYVASASATTGSVFNLTNAQAASAGDGVEADVVEAPLVGAPQTIGPTKYSGASVTNGGAVNPNNALASDEARTEFDSTGDFIEVTGLNLPADAVTVNSLTIGYEGRKAATGGTSPTARLDYKVGLLGVYSTGSNIVESATVDTDRTRSLTGSFTVADVEDLYVRVFYVTDTNRNLQVDHVFVTVTYQTAASTVYALDVQLEWSDVPTGSTHSLELRYRATGDSFTAQVWNFGTLTWRACAGSLASAALTTFSCSVSPTTEYAAGEVRVRLVDATPAGTTQGHLYLDHARVGTA